MLTPGLRHSPPSFAIRTFAPAHNRARFHKPHMQKRGDSQQMDSSPGMFSAPGEIASKHHAMKTHI